MDVVVTGATGTVGRHAAAGLAAGGAAVRATSRQAPAADPAGSGRAQRVRFSFTDPSTWSTTFAGARRLFLVRPPELVNITRDVLPAVRAARDAGGGHMVFLSVLGANTTRCCPIAASNGGWRPPAWPQPTCGPETSCRT